jgi:prepilin peptidase CpaA
VILGLAAVSDVRHRRVPNNLNLVLCTAGLVFAAAGIAPSGGLGAAALSMVLALAIWLPLWLLRLLGGGDVKFFVASAAWLPPSLVWRAAVLAALLGGGVSVLWLLRRGRPVAAGHESLPYIVPMALALGLAMLMPAVLAQCVVP